MVKFELSFTQANNLLACIRKETLLAKQLSAHEMANGKILIPDHVFDAESLEQLWRQAERDNDKSLMFQMIALRHIRSGHGHDLVVTRLEMLVPALVDYFETNGIDGWIYRRNTDGVLLPWLIDSIEYIQTRDGPYAGIPFVSIQLLANTITSTSPVDDDSPEQWRTGMTNAILFYQRELGKLTIPELLAQKGFYKECTEFKEEYTKQAGRFQNFQPFYGKQFLAKHSGFLIREGDSRLFKNLELFRISPETSARCVNDEEILERRIETHSDRRNRTDDMYSRIPLHCYLHMFHLELHRNCWIHVDNLEEYQYRPELKTKLILPPEHRKLIDILTSHMDVSTSDIVPGKSEGTTILCMGAAGLGKTLTAEVYSEVVSKPLYRVHSGQLGTSATSVEAALADILKRASRWDSILLLDEADVYIRKRDNDLQHNAIVAEFLRTLEYFNGLLFMTTNRIDDVDDAILSRCIAVIRYETPPREDAIRLWRTLSDQFQIDIPDELIGQLVREFPNSSGRDIKELLKLTSRLCLSCNMPVSIEAFHQCAVFRGKKQAARRESKYPFSCHNACLPD